jgi:hypothetical protein
VPEHGNVIAVHAVILYLSFFSHVTQFVSSCIRIDNMHSYRNSGYRCAHRGNMDDVTHEALESHINDSQQIQKTH